MDKISGKVILCLALMAFAAAALTLQWGFWWPIVCFGLIVLLLLG